MKRKKMRFKSFYSLLEGRFLRVSMDGLIKDYPVAVQAIKGGYLQLEAYEALTILTKDKEIERIDREYIIFVQRTENDGFHPYVFPKQDHYTEEEYKAMCHVTGITVQECDEIIEAGA